jgi:hypothetical protein
MISEFNSYMNVRKVVKGLRNPKLAYNYVRASVLNRLRAALLDIIGKKMSYMKPTSTDLCHE